MKLEMKDAPGQLVAALQPISDVGGNIIAVIHQRDEKAEDDKLEVQIVLEIQDDRLNELIARIKGKGVNVVRIGKRRLLYTQTVIMIGHIMHTDLGDTVDRIDCTGFAEVTDMNMVMPAINEPSSALIVIRAVDRNEMEQTMEILRTVAKEKDLLIIEPLEEFV
jgi:ACT domain-containing protein